MLIYLDIDGFKAESGPGAGAGDGRFGLNRGGAVVRMGKLVFHGDAEPVSAEDYLQAVLRELTREGLSFCAGLAPLEGPLAPALAQADEALRRAKAQGPGQLCWGVARASRPALAGPR